MLVEKLKMRPMFGENFSQKNESNDNLLPPIPFLIHGEKNSPTDNCDFLRSSYIKEISEKDLFCLVALEKDWKQVPPFTGRRVLVNAHMTLATLPLIRLMLLAGAEVDITSAPELAVHENIVDIVKNAGLDFYRNADIPLQKKDHYYDIVFDCGAGMLNSIKPKIGMVELTHTDPNIYSEIDFPVITVDTSKTKKLETGFGTGDGFIRVLTHYIKSCIYKDARDYSQQQSTTSPQAGEACNEYFKNEDKTSLPLIFADFRGALKSRKFIIFGYGKVGKGIVSALKFQGIPEENIIVVETDLSIIMEINENGYVALHLDLENLQSLIEIKETLSNPDIYCVITATGIKNAISTYFEPSDFHEKTLLVNMGTPDEYGHKFPIKRIYNNKMPANFRLKYPTKVKYLDPIFTILTIAANELLSRKNDLRNGLNDVSKETDDGVLKQWMRHYKNSVWGDPNEQNTEIAALRFDIMKKPLNQERWSKLARKHSIFKETENPLSPASCFSPVSEHTPDFSH